MVPTLSRQASARSPESETTVESHPQKNKGWGTLRRTHRHPYGSDRPLGSVDHAGHKLELLSQACPEIQVLRVNKGPASRGAFVLMIGAPPSAFFCARNLDSESTRPRQTSLQERACRRTQGLDVKKTTPPGGEGRVFFLDIPFYRTHQRVTDTRRFVGPSCGLWIPSPPSL
jgi:hypothetical protein